MFLLIAKTFFKIIYIFQKRAILAVGSLISLLPDPDRDPVKATIDAFMNKVNVTQTNDDFAEECPIYLEALKNSNHPKCMEFMKNFWDLSSKIADSSRLALTTLNYLERNYEAEEPM